MARTYNIINEFQNDDRTEDSYVSPSPYWIVMVLPYFQPVTFSRTKLFDGQPDVSFQDNKENIDRIKTPVIIGNGGVESLSISFNKSSFASNLQATLTNSHLNYLAKIMPGDLVMSWIVNSRTKYNEILSILRGKNERKQANLFYDGFKFLGRVDSLRKSEVQSSNGPRHVQYNLSCVGFREFDFNVFFDPQLSLNNPSVNQFLARLGKSILDLHDKTVTGAATGKGGITSNEALPFLLKVLFGTGIPPKAVDPSGKLPLSSGGLFSNQDSEDEPPYSLAIPKLVGTLLGRPNPSKPNQKLAYIDVIEVMLGVQQYGSRAGSDAVKIFTQDDITKKSETIKLCGGTNGKLLGTFLPISTPFSGRNAWSILSQYINFAVNEMYTSMRVNEDGKVLPTLTVRQIPFSTNFAAEKKQSRVTPFLSLPRWIADPVLIRAIEYGRSEAMHFNMIQVYGQAPTSANVESGTSQAMRPGQEPKLDTFDITRHGMKTYQQTVNCAPTDTFGGPAEWMQILGDFVLGQQYTLTGSCVLQGVSAPIAVGDNFEADGTVFHIEGVTHNCSISGGTKTFTTSLTLTNGIRTDVDKDGSSVFTDEDNEYSDSKKRENLDAAGISGSKQASIDDIVIYSGLDSDDNSEFNPGLTVDLEDDNG